jgi:K+-sensing histidine kinase KdpD
LTRLERLVVEPVRRLTVRGLPPRYAAVLGAGAIGLVGLLDGAFGHGLGPAGQALLLVVPVTATAVLGGRLPALIAAAAATLTFTLLLPPVGTLHIRFAQDLVALVVFSVVAFTISNLVAYRIEALGWLERQRAALLRSVSHDLRTPLAVISAAAAELEDPTLHDEASRRRLLELVSDEADRLDRLVGNLLSLARVEGGGLRPRRQAVDLAELVEACVGRLGNALAGVEVAVDSPTDLPVVLADHTLLDQVVTNLLDNAARHSPAGEPIEVELRADHRTVTMRVIDHGPGVPAGQLAMIFEPFRSGTTGGSSGLGLAICKAVVEAHAGTIAAGVSPRGGAVVTVILPRR